MRPCCFYVACVLGLLAWCPLTAVQAQAPNSSSESQTTRAVAARAPSVLSRASLDETVAPCTDFYQYANGGWLKTHPIPPTQVSWSIGAEMNQRNQTILRRLLDQAAADHTALPGSNRQKVGDFYATALDSAAVEAAGLRFLRPYLARLAAVRDRAGLQRLLADPKAQLGNAWYQFEVIPDLKQSDVYSIEFSQAGLTLPDRDYYLRQDARTQAIRAAYQRYLVNTFQLLGDSPAAAARNAAAVQRLETRLAQASRSAVALRDPQANYTNFSLAQAHRDYPNLNLPLVLRQGGLGAAQRVVLDQPDFFREVNTLLGTVALADQQAYLRWHLVLAATPALPQAFADEARRYEQVLRGPARRPARWQQSLALTNQLLGQAFGQLYVAEAFPATTKLRVQRLVENLRQAYAERIDSTKWMSAATKAQARQKLRAMTAKIGYPEKWQDYSALSITRASYLTNLFAARAFVKQNNRHHYGQPVDRTEWLTTPSTINAYYRVEYNEIVLPAAILQPPYFNPAADDAVNYSAIGVVIGHEMTHGFDDEGRQFDAQGNLRDWWTPEDAAQFRVRAAVVGAQYEAFTPLDSMHVNGQLTMGENLADLGGLTIAYQAFQKTSQAQAGQSLDGFTPNQRFFLSFAQLFAVNQRPEVLRQLLQTNPHAPSQYRVNGPLMNLPEFAEAFGCQSGSHMLRNAAARARIW